MVQIKWNIGYEDMNQMNQMNQLMTCTNDTTWINEHMKRVNESVMKHNELMMNEYTTTMGSVKKMKCYVTGKFQTC